MTDHPDPPDATPEPFGWEQWQWDETLYSGAARFYRRGRAPYAPGVPDAVRDVLDLDGTGRLLDVGCGPGVIALLLAPLFNDVVGVDADAEMLREAQWAARDRNVSNARWAQLRAEALPADLGTFRVVSFAQSFHWMDRPVVARAVRQMIEASGAVVQIDAWYDAPPGEAVRAGAHPGIPVTEIDELRMHFLGADRRAGQGVRNTSPSDEDAIFQAAGFFPEETVAVPDERILDRTVDDIVAWVFSASSTAPHLFGGRLAEFENELRRLLGSTSPAGLFSVPLHDNRIRVRRPIPR